MTLRTRAIRQIAAAAGLAALLSQPASAIPITFTDYAAFEAALQGNSTVSVDFEETAPGTTIASGETLGGIRFDYDFGGVSLQVTDLFDTTSPQRSLGTTDGGVLTDGDDFLLSFAPLRAIGLFFVTADAMFDDDITLSAAGASVGLNAAQGGTPFADGGVPYFLGIIDWMTPFTTASVTTIGGGFFLYNVDDIITAPAVPVPVPEPGALGLLVAGFAGFLAAKRRGMRACRA